MDFHARQYDPQIGRFLAVDPLADDGGQQVFSPYAAMGNAPESMVDPNGTQLYRSMSLGESKAPPHPMDEALRNYYNPMNFGRGDPFSQASEYGWMQIVFHAMQEQRQEVANRTLGTVSVGQLQGSFSNNSGGSDGDNNDPKDGNKYEDRSTSLYKVPDKKAGKHTLQEWVEHYDGKTWEAIVNERPKQTYLGGLIKFLGGPNTKWRYVELEDGKILDMRHVLIVGMKFGAKAGAAGEIGQYIFAPSSANQVQDYYSNEIGEGFLQYLQQNSIYYNPKYSTQQFGNTHETNLSNYFYKYINNR